MMYKGGEPVSVSAIIPAYNEALTIGQVIAVLKRVPLINEIMVVNDGSVDDTGAIAHQTGVRVINLNENRGKGSAMVAGARQAAGDWLVFLDADLEGLTPRHVYSLLEPALAGAADMTIGIFNDGRRSTDLAQAISPYISGQRVISRQAFLEAGVDNSRFEVEVILSRYAHGHHMRVQKVALPNMTHMMKEEKRGVTRGLVQRMGMYKDITYCLCRPRRISKKRSRTAYMGLVMLMGLALFGYNLSYVTVARAEGGRLTQIKIGNRNRLILVISPHPDDEVLAAGGLIAQAVKNGDTVHVVYLTSGDGFLRGLEFYKRILKPNAQDYLNYGADRMQEAISAQGKLGVKPEQITFLGYPDGGLNKIWNNGQSGAVYTSPRTKCPAVPYDEALSPGASYTATSIQADLKKVLTDFGPTDIFVSDPQDSHSDHRTGSLLALSAVASWQQSAPSHQVHVYSFLVHAGLWQLLPNVRKNEILLPPQKFLARGTHWFTLPLTSECYQQKTQAINQVQSQMKVIPTFMTNFLRPNEVFSEIQVSELNYWTGKNKNNERPATVDPNGEKSINILNNDTESGIL
jgi:LmbE family N-acetylglucosaminyl deacetylase